MLVISSEALRNRRRDHHKQQQVRERPGLGYMQWIGVPIARQHLRPACLADDLRLPGAQCVKPY